jgi:hypothetical protein
MGPPKKKVGGDVMISKKVETKAAGKNANNKSEIENETFGDVSEIFGMWNALKIISNVNKFKNWLISEHNLSDVENTFEGYKFLFECAFNGFFHGLTYDDHLGIEEDFLFHRARFAGVELSKIPNSCEKILLLKHIYKSFKLIKRSKNYKEIKSAIYKFKVEVLDVFEEIFRKYINIDSNLRMPKEELLNHATMFYVYIFLNDLHRGPPNAYYLNIFDRKLMMLEPSIGLYILKEKRFYGYKYALQFIWSELLGEKYANSKITRMHEATD